MNDLRLLAIETSGARGTVALAVDGHVAERVIATPRQQTELVLMLADELMHESGIALGDLDALVFGRGPGSFTGLRVAAAVVQGLSVAKSVPIVSVSSLAALAQAGFENSAGAGAAALACVDARMGEVYSACFEWFEGKARPTTDERLEDPGLVDVPDGSFIALGDGFAAHAPHLSHATERASVVDAEAVATARQLLTLGEADVRSGRFVPLQAALPAYLRGSDAWRRPS